MKVIVKNEIRKFNGTIAGPHWIPPIEFYEVDVQCPSSGFCFKINNKDLYNTCKIGDILDVEIVEVYSKIFFNPFEKDFLKFKITDFKKVSHE